MMVGPYALVSGPLMSRRSLRPQLNQIRSWVRGGRTDAWIAHQLEVTVQQIQSFKREQGLAPEGGEAGAPAAGAPAAAAADAPTATAPSRPRSSTATRATACGWTPPSPTTPCTPSTGP